MVAQKKISFRADVYWPRFIGQLRPLQRLRLFGRNLFFISLIAMTDDEEPHSHKFAGVGPGSDPRFLVGFERASSISLSLFGGMIFGID
jgi:hypothetical protein